MHSKKYVDATEDDGPFLLARDASTPSYYRSQILNLPLQYFVIFVKNRTQCYLSIGVLTTRASIAEHNLLRDLTWHDGGVFDGVMGYQFRPPISRLLVKIAL